MHAAAGSQTDTDDRLCAGCVIIETEHKSVGMILDCIIIRRDET